MAGGCPAPIKQGKKFGERRVQIHLPYQYQGKYNEMSRYRSSLSHRDHELSFGTADKKLVAIHWRNEGLGRTGSGVGEQDLGEDGGLD